VKSENIKTTNKTQKLHQMVVKTLMRKQMQRNLSVCSCLVTRMQHIIITNTWKTWQSSNTSERQ